MTQHSTRCKLPMLIHIENPTDPQATRKVIRLAFGRDDEAFLADALRDGGYVRLSLVAEVERLVVGHILSVTWPSSAKRPHSRRWLSHRWPCCPNISDKELAHS